MTLHDDFGEARIHRTDAHGSSNLLDVRGRTFDEGKAPSEGVHLLFSWTDWTSRYTPRKPSRWVSRSRPFGGLETFLVLRAARGIAESGNRRRMTGTVRRVLHENLEQRCTPNVATAITLLIDSAAVFVPIQHGDNDERAGERRRGRPIGMTETWIISSLCDSTDKRHRTLSPILADERNNFNVKLDEVCPRRPSVIASYRDN